MINFRFITNIIGKLLFVESAFLILCIIVALIYGENDLMAFVYSAIITLGVGSLMTFTVKVKDRVLAKKDGYFIVTCTWIIFTIFGCLPYLFGGTIPSIVDAIFETMSGFTTTGSSVINNVEALPHATLFWRSLTQWMGGMGIIVLLLAIIPGLGIEGRDLFVAEVPGPTHDKFTATFKSTARRMWYLYISLTAAQAILLLLGNMDLLSRIHNNGYWRIFDQTSQPCLLGLRIHPICGHYIHVYCRNEFRLTLCHVARQIPQIVS